jgi:hypothetical protein
MPNRRRLIEAQQPELYEILLRGRLGPTLLEAFPDVSARRREQDMVLRGPLPDRSALYGVIHHLDALGLEMLEVRRPSADRARRQGG